MLHLLYEELCQTAAVWHLSVVGDEKGDSATTLGTLASLFVSTCDIYGSAP